MTDLLTHVLFVYVVLTVVSWRIEGIERYISVGMVGAVIPDIVKIHLFIGPKTVQSALGVPFSWAPIHRLGGTVLLAGIAALFFARRVRVRAFGFLLAGATTGFVLDAGLKRANRVTPPYFYPLSWWQPPSGDLYLSSDAWPAMVAILVAAVIWTMDR